MLSEAQQLHGRYSQELASYKAALQDLKISFFKRQIDKGRLRPAGEQLAQLGPVADFNNPQHVEALDKLQRLVARALLDPACQDGITAADTLHKKVCQTLSFSDHPCVYRCLMGCPHQRRGYQEHCTQPAACCQDNCVHQCSCA